MEGPEKEERCTANHRTSDDMDMQVMEALVQPEPPNQWPKNGSLDHHAKPGYFAPRHCWSQDFCQHINDRHEAHGDGHQDHAKFDLAFRGKQAGFQGHMGALRSFNSIALTRFAANG